MSKSYVLCRKLALHTYNIQYCINNMIYEIYNVNQCNILQYSKLPILCIKQLTTNWIRHKTQNRIIALHESNWMQSHKRRLFVYTYQENLLALLPILATVPKDRGSQGALLNSSKMKRPVPSALFFVKVQWIGGMPARVYKMPDGSIVAINLLDIIIF